MSEKLIDKFKYIMGIEEVDEEEENSFAEVKKSENNNNTVAYAQFQREAPKEDKKLIDLNKQKVRMKLVLNEPSAYEDCQKIVDNLRSRKPVIMNLENVEPDVARSLFEFVSGATYALNGSVQKVSNGIFVFAPDNVDISSDIKEFKTLTSADLFR